MNIASSIKRAPRWAWYTAAGVGVGAAGIKLWRNRANDAADQAAQDATSVGTPTDATQYGGGSVGGSPPGIIVPPVIIPSDNSDGGSLTDLMALYMGAISDTLGITTSVYQDVYGPIAQTIPDIIRSQMDAGSAPQPVSQNPTPVMIQQPIDQPIPVVIGSSNQPTSGGVKCNASFPHLGPGGQSCYRHEKRTATVNGKKVCKVGKLWMGGTFEVDETRPGAC